jgi:hypothetical protein
MVDEEIGMPAKRELIWLYSIHAAGAAALDWSGLKKYILTSQKGQGPWRHYVDGLPGLVGPDVSFGHKVLLRSVPSTGQIIAYVEVLGVLRIGGVYGMGIRGEPLVEHFYIYDLDTRRDRSSEFHVDSATFDGKDWASFGVAPFELDSLTRHYQDIFPAVLGARYAKRYEPKDVGGDPK